MTQWVSLPSGIGGSEPKDRVCACLGQVAGHELADGFVRSVRDGVGVVVGGGAWVGGVRGRGAVGCKIVHGCTLPAKSARPVSV